MKLSAILAVLLVVGATPAFANIPVNDAAQLTQKSDTASTTIKLVPVTTQRKEANSGVKCAVTTGKKASITNPAVQPQAGAGAQSIQSYGPDLPLSKDATAQGAALNSQTLFQSSGDVVGGLDASRSTITAAKSGFQTATGQVGTAQTVMAALDYFRLIYAVIFGYLIFSQLPGISTWIGAGIIVAASLYTIQRERRKKQVLLRTPEGRGLS